MIALAIEASGASASVRLEWKSPESSSEKAFFLERSLSGRALAESLVPALEEMFVEANCSAAEIGRVIVASGPGSFTGIRTALSFALGFSAGFTLDKSVELYAISVFVAGCVRLNQGAQVNQVASGEPQRIFAWTPASPTDAYYTVLVLSAETLKEEVPPAVIDLDKIESAAKELNARAVKIEGITAQDVLAAFELFRFESPSEQLRPFSWINPIEPLYIKGVQAQTLSERSARLSSQAI